jgi:hypothetical protein
MLHTVGGADLRTLLIAMVVGPGVTEAAHSMVRQDSSAGAYCFGDARLAAMPVEEFQ